jgi:broad specificity phosphatase PhoE
VTAALARIVRENRGKTIAAVAHGTLFQLFLLRLWQLPLTAKREIPVLHNTGYCGLGIEDDGSVRVLCYDMTAHLPAELIRGKLGKSSGHDYVGKTFHFAEFQK